MIDDAPWLRVTSGAPEREAWLYQVSPHALERVAPPLARLYSSDQDS